MDSRVFLKSVEASHPGSVALAWGLMSCSWLVNVLQLTPKRSAKLKIVRVKSFFML
jgi:predicted nucleic acid binding AN1-type Zn finger protein